MEEKDFLKYLDGQYGCELEEKIIRLDYETYQKLKEILNSDQKNIYFSCEEDESILSISNNKKSNNTSNAQNIVERWMKDIKSLAQNGYQNAREHVSERDFLNIKSYCDSVITSVTSQK